MWILHHFPGFFTIVTAVLTDTLQRISVRYEQILIIFWRGGAWPKEQESLADAKGGARQRCVYEGPSEEIYSISSICDFLLMVSSNRGRITYGLRDIFVCRG